MPASDGKLGTGRIEPFCSKVESLTKKALNDCFNSLISKYTEGNQRLFFRILQKYIPNIALKHFEC